MMERHIALLCLKKVVLNPLGRNSWAPSTRMGILSTRPLLSYCSVFKRPNYTKNFKEAKGVMKGKSGVRHRCNLLLESCIGWPMGLWLCRPYWPLGLGRPHCPGAPPLGLDLVIRIGKDPLIGYFHIPRHPCLYVLVLVLCTLINPILFSHTFLQNLPF